MNTKKIINLIIDELEGGYYHPDMKDKLRGGETMGISGETMFGIDRKNGGSDVTTSDAGKKFWDVVDANWSDKHGNTHYYNDKADGTKTPAAVGKLLRELVAILINNRFKKYSQYFDAPVLQIVKNNPALMLQFLYACWNGSGNFQNFAKVLNNAYKNGERDLEKYFELVNQARRNKGGLFIKQADILDDLKNKVKSSNWWLWLLGGAFGLYLILKK